MKPNEAETLIDEFATATRAVAWAEAGGDDAEEDDVEAAETAKGNLLSALTKSGATDAQALIEIFGDATRAVAWAEAGGDDAEDTDVQAAEAAKAQLLAGLAPKTPRPRMRP